MNILKSIAEFFFPKKKAQEENEHVSIIESLPMNTEQARIIPLIDKNLEFKDLHEKHGEFFNELSSQQQFQSKIGVNTSANIEDVTSSRSDKFFQNAPNVAADNYRPDFKTEDDFEKLEKYMGVDVHEEEEQATDMVIFN